MRSDLLGPSEVEGTDYLLSSTMRLEDSFLQILDMVTLKPSVDQNLARGFRCGNEHTGDTCSMDPENATCLMCEGNHFATDKSCPEFNRQREIKHTMMTHQNISYLEAIKLHPPVSKSYANVLISTPIRSSSENSNGGPSVAHRPQSLSYKKKISIRPRERVKLGKSYDQQAHNEIIKTPKFSEMNGTILKSQSSSQDPLQPSLISDVTSALISTMSQFNIHLLSNAALNVITQILNVINNGSGSTVQGSPVELSQFDQ